MSVFRTVSNIFNIK